MRKRIFFTRNLALFLLAIAAMVVSVPGQSSPDATKFGHITIKNFGQMDTNYFRGGQPKKDEYKQLADLGVNTVVDLRNDPTDYERTSAEALGMKYINIPMDDAEYPSGGAIAKFLETINDPKNGVMYVHCKGGKHRAGVTGAVYRFTKYGWDYDKAMREMENYNFDTSWGRKVMKQFVVDYAAQMREPHTAAAAQSN